jgi:hypothetical protein
LRKLSVFERKRQGQRKVVNGMVDRVVVEVFVVWSGWAGW